MAFIVIEGGEGAGKSTQAALLKERLPGAFPHIDFVFTREPGGTPFADKIRELILSPGAAGVNNKTMFSLFAAARFEHAERVIGPALQSGKTVICERFVAASYAYQIVAEESLELLPMYREQLHLLDQYLSHLMIVLDVETATGL